MYISNLINANPLINMSLKSRIFKIMHLPINTTLKIPTKQNASYIVTYVFFGQEDQYLILKCKHMTKSDCPFLYTAINICL